MNKKELIILIDSLNLPKDEYVIINTGSLVLRGLKEKAGDLDLHVTEECFDYIKDNFEIFDKDPNRTQHDLNFGIKDKNVEFFVHKKSELEYENIDGYPAEYLEPILDYKIIRNAPKDQDDITNICQYLNIELRDLYDESRAFIGRRIRKTDKVSAGCYYNTVAIYIQNSKDEFLIQKRSSIKGGKWATTGGHPKSGEDSINGLRSEVKEEIGIDIDISKLKLVKTVKTEDDFFDLYYINMEVDLNDIVMQTEEVSDVKWATIEEIVCMIENGTYKSSHGFMFRDCIKYLKEKH